MKTILIYPEDIIPKTRFMHDREGRYDLLGQIFFSGYQINIPVNCRTPQELKRAVHPFVVVIRQTVYALTPLTLQLLKNSSLPGKKQMGLANELLKEYNIQLITEKELETLKEEL